jgi:hypothetical protein
MSITLDLSQYPVVLTKFDGEQTAAEVEDYIRRMSGVHARGAPYVVVTWLKRFARAQTMTERMGRWVKDTEAVTRRLCAAAGLISQTAALRFGLSAVFLIKPLPCPYRVCGGFAEATTFVREEARKRGLLLPGSVANPWPDLDG